MTDAGFIEGKEGERDMICTHCGAEAIWRFLDEEESRVEVECPDCGRFEMSRAEFEVAESDISAQEERRE